VYVGFNGSATLSKGHILSNTSSNSGGGIFNAGALSLANITISGNVSTSGSGGGIYSARTSVLTYTTVASNTAASGGGGIHWANGTALLNNTIVANNGTANCSGALTSNGHNLDSDDTCSLTSTTDITSTNPLLGPLTYDRGTWVHPLLDGSPAINAGDCVPAVTTVDQRGVTRPEGGACDIGAYEWVWQKVYLPLLLRND
jgi:predicted outer membrane repeat protein